MPPWALDTYPTLPACACVRADAHGAWHPSPPRQRARARLRLPHRATSLLLACPAHPCGQPARFRTNDIRTRFARSGFLPDRTAGALAGSAHRRSRILRPARCCCQVLATCSAVGKPNGNPDQRSPIRRVKNLKLGGDDLTGSSSPACLTASIAATRPCQSVRRAGRRAQSGGVRE